MIRFLTWLRSILMAAMNTVAKAVVLLVLVFVLLLVFSLARGDGLPGNMVLALDLRAAIERDLVDEYHRALLSYGVSNYDRETCWRDYRLGVLQALLISALGFAFASATDRGDDMVLTMLARGCQAIRELGTIDLVGQYASEQATTS